MVTNGQLVLGQGSATVNAEGVGRRAVGLCESLSSLNDLLAQVRRRIKETSDGMDTTVQKGISSRTIHE